jgi:hypothetical protein
MTFQEFIDRTYSEGNVTIPQGYEGSASATIEALASHVLVAVAERAAADKARRHLVTRTVTIVLTNGSGALPAQVLVGFVDKDTVVADPLDATMVKKMRWTSSYMDFIRTADPTLGLFTTINGATLLVTRPGVAYVAGSGYTGNVSVTTPCAPQVPALATDTVDISNELTQEACLTLADAFKKTIKGQSLAGDP